MSELSFKTAKREDAELLVDIYNSAFYADYVRYGECPAYGRTRERMEESIEKFPKQIIIHNNNPVGVISVQNKGNGEYYLGCLCVIPKYQGMGIGTKAVEYILNLHTDWREITLITPADKEENVKFYIEKCNFIMLGTEMDGNVKVAHFLLKR